MENCSLNVFGSPKAQSLLSGSGSGKGRKSENRYTPTRNEESEFELGICQDSLEVPRPRSRLIEFTQLRDGEEKQVIMPLFFHSKKSPQHHRQGSLKPAKREKSDIGEMLLGLRAKPKPKSSLKREGVRKHKTVSFCSEIEQMSPEDLGGSVVFVGEKDVVQDSLENISRKTWISSNVPMGSNENLKEKVPESTASTQQNVEKDEESEVESVEVEEIGRGKFQFEAEVRSSLNNREVEFNEYSTIAYCERCKREVVSAVGFERYRGQSCGEITEWLLCWIFPDCMSNHKKLVHKCSSCGFELAKVEW